MTGSACCRFQVLGAQAEMRQGLSYFHETIFPSLPSVLPAHRHRAAAQIGQPKLPLDHNLFQGLWQLDGARRP